MNLVLDWGSYQLPGRVLDSKGQPVPVSDIYLIWTLRENGVSSSSTRKTAANAEGYFLFTQLGQGLHKILINNAPGFEKFELEYDVSLDGEEVLVQLQELSP